MRTINTLHSERPGVKVKQVQHLSRCVWGKLRHFQSKVKTRREIGGRPESGYFVLDQPVGNSEM